MKKLTTAALLVGGAVMASQSSFGQFTANDLYLGFENQAGGGTNDYMVNLGPASSLVNSPTVVNLTGDFSLSDFDVVLENSSSLLGGVVGGLQTGIGTADIYLTQLRNGGSGNVLFPGSSVTATIGRSGIDSAISTLNQLSLPSAGSGLLDPTKSWEAYVEPTLSSGTFLGNTGINPDSAINPSSVFYEDLWSAANGTLSGSSSYNYLGYFTLDLTDSEDPSLTFTPVPEPTIYDLVGGGCLLLLALRRRSIGKNA